MQLLKVIDISILQNRFLSSYLEVGDLPPSIELAPTCIKNLWNIVLQLIVIDTGFSLSTYLRKD